MPRNYFTPQEKESIFAAKTYILHHLHRPLHPKALAQQAGLSKRRLNEGFLHFFERSVASFIHESRMQTACFLLRHTQPSVKEVALRSGYRQQQNFQNAFRRFFDCTPGSVRNRNLEQE